MLKKLLPCALGLFIAGGGFIEPASASDRDHKFFKKIEGQWSGPGEIIAGKYKGTKFTCKLKGDTPGKNPGMSLDGQCRVGLFTQKMSARVERRGRHYKGSFLDGSGGKGLDVVSGNVSSERVVLSLVRNSLKGAMLARLAGDNAMHVTVSVRVDKKLVPVIGMRLKRTGGKVASAN